MKTELDWSHHSRSMHSFKCKKRVKGRKISKSKNALWLGIKREAIKTFTLLNLYLFMSVYLYILSYNCWFRPSWAPLLFPNRHNFPSKSAFEESNMLKIKWKYTTLTFRINTLSEGILFYGNFCVASNPKQNSSWFNIFIWCDEILLFENSNNLDNWNV